VHKGIKPENILVMTNPGALPKNDFPYVLGWPFLVGFERSRPASAHSGKFGEVRLADSLYQHPSRWGVVAEEAFTMQHDIYSLGVVLLEIGLWQPLVWYNKMLERHEYSHLFSDVFQARDADVNITRSQHALTVKRRLLDLAQQLPPTMGETYADVVIACLNILESGTARKVDFHRIPSDEGVGIAYIKNIVRKLEGLNAI
jgi:serine/threonine protein kinase